MEYYSISDRCYADACLVFILTGVICGIIRWMHMCKPYDREEAYFYPARRQVAFFFFAIIMQLPYFFCPSDAGIWVYIRSYGIIYYPVFISILFRRFFQLREFEGWKNYLYLWLPMLLLVCMLFTILAHNNTWLERQAPWIYYLIGCISILLSIRLLLQVRWLKNEIDKYHKANFSSEEDFPYHFAERVIWLPFVWIFFMWGVFITGSRGLKAFLDIFFSVWEVLLLCHILHPQRMLRSAKVEKRMHDIEEEEKKVLEESIDDANGFDVENEKNTTEAFSEEVKNIVLAAILRRYREPHLLKTEILADIDKGKIVQASRFIASVGYYNLINMFRLRYAQLYQEANPRAKQAEIAEAAGFISDSAFSKAKKNVKNIDSNFVAEVHL